MMAIVVEDGTQVAGSNSYVSRADLIAYAATFGVTIADTTASDAYLVESASYINQHEQVFNGNRTARDQSMPWPRYAVVIDDWYWNHNEIPTNVKLAQYHYAMDIASGIDLWNRPVNPNLAAIEQRVEGAVTVVYSRSKGMTEMGAQQGEYQSKGDAYLATFIRSSGPMISLQRN